MASVIIQISKKSPSEELFDLLRGLNEENDKSLKNFNEVNNEELLELTLKNLPNLLSMEAEVKERFTLIGFVFANDLVKVVEGLAECGNNSAAVQALAMLYTVTANLYLKFRVFRGIMQLVIKDSSLMTLVQPHLIKIDKFVDSWGQIPISELSSFIQSLLTLNISNNKKASLIFRLLAEGGLEGESADQIISKLIETTTEFDFSDLMSLPGFHKSTASVQSLIQHLSSSSIQEIESFWSKESSNLTSKGFIKNKLIESGRIAGIVNLAKASSKVTFQEIAARLDLNEEEVDLWVVRAISGGLVQGKIDTISKIVTFEKGKNFFSKQAVKDLIQELEDTLASN